MNLKTIRLYLAVFILIFSCFTGIGTASELVKIPSGKEQLSHNSAWTFVGKATNESGEHLYYYFDVQLKNAEKAVNIFMVNQSNKDLLHYQFSQVQKQTEKPNSWKIGKAFVRYNTITNSWIFGLKDEVKSFNFREELIQQAQDETEPRTIVPGLKLKFQSAKRLNGHVRWGANAKEEFVTSDHNMYRYLSNDARLSTLSNVQGVFCLQDSGIYFSAVQVALQNGQPGTVIEWYNAVSELIKVKPTLNVQPYGKDSDGLIIRAASARLEMEQSLTGNTSLNFKAGYNKAQKEGPGFCFVDSVDLNESTL